jgi:very-short-patch-repair endonuclease
VAYHPNRYEQDSEKDFWMKKAGILCIQHYTAERCYKETAQVVDEFLSVLQKHAR